MAQCAAKYCDAETNNPSTFFRFPSSSFQTRRSLWVKKTGANISLTDNECYLCPKHFGPDQFRNRSLRWDAVPNLFLEPPVAWSGDSIVQSPVQKTRGRKRKKRSTKYTEKQENSPSNNISSDDEYILNSTHESSSSPVRSTSYSSLPTEKVQPQMDTKQASVQSSCDDVVDFEEEIDRLKDPLFGQPTKKRKDEDVRTRFTEEDDIPLDKLILGVKKVNPFNTDLPLPTLVRKNTDSILIEEEIENVPDELLETSDKEPEYILGDAGTGDDLDDTSKEITTNLNDTSSVAINSEENENNKFITETGTNGETKDSPNANGSTTECLILCSSCDYYASTEENLRDHEKKLHGGVDKVTTKVYPFKILTKSDGGQFYLCDFCNFSGPSMTVLVSHMVTHFPKENNKGLVIQKYCATVAVPGKNKKDVVTVSMKDSSESPEVVEIIDDDEEDEQDSLNSIVISDVAAGKTAVTKLLHKSKTSPKKKNSIRKRPYKKR